MFAVVRRAPYALMLLLALFVATVSLRYLLPETPGASPNVMENPFAGTFLPMHAAFAATALFLGPFQFWGRRDAKSGEGRRAVWHKLTGALYIAACLGGGVTGLVLALGTTAGPVAVAGFGLLALSWLYTNTLGLRAVLAGRYDEHRRWMIRSYALTFAAVMLRLYLPIAPSLGYEFMPAYVAISWLCWVPNLIIAELFLVRARPLGNLETVPLRSS